MRKSITPNQIKQNNKNLIYLYILNHPGVSQQDIAYDLRLSRPTVTTNLNELESVGMITKSGQLDTELVGRKANAYSAVPDYRVSIGVDIHSKELKLITVNLLGEYSERVVHSINYKNTDSYRKKVCEIVNGYIAGQGLKSEQILGIGIAMPGLVSPDGSEITYGKILDCTGLSIDGFSKYLNYPCRFFHDSESAAVSELWVSPELKDAMYIQIGIHLGAAMIMNRKIMSGMHGHNATIEHIFMGNNNKRCYCGRIGCAETLCALPSLCGEEPVHEFFGRLRSGDKNASKQFDNYLKDLAKIINSISLMYDKDFIIGGFIAPYLQESDMDKLHKYVQELNPFDDEGRFIFISRMPKHNITIGAALPYITEFLNRDEIE
ncbi:ROK family protein [Butyrivibrio sp. JL13D10]|uniref:ROK family transcriptional regulator n=1 Tax=Butyrivibrio sp. JL13D10 TaxID=3236815 RepID=UPI0038B682A4